MIPFSLFSSQTTVRGLGIGLVLLLTVGVVTWPMVFHLTNALPLGTEQESTVPLFNTWTLWWVQERAIRGFENFWQAPIFFPTDGTFTFSEPQPLTGLLVLPFWFFSDSPPGVYNSAILICLFLNGVFGYRLGRALQGSPIFALLGGMLLVGLPYTAKLLGVLPLIPVFGMLWALEGFVRFGEDGSWRMAWWTATGLLVQVLTSQQLALLFGIFVLPAGLIALRRQGFSTVAWVRLGSVGVIVVLLTGWYAWYPFHLHESLAFIRSENVVAALSARPSDYFSRPLTASFPFPSKEHLHSDTGGLFPGFVLLLLGALGSRCGIRQPEIREWTWYFVGTGLAAFLLSLGIHSPVDGGTVLSLLREWVPGFQELRSPFRFAVFVQISLVFLGLLGLAGLARMIHVPAGVPVVCVLGILALAENLSIPQPLAPFENSFRSPWIAWIQAHEDRKVLAHVPFPEEFHVSDYQIETERMLAQVIHGKPLINGYSGYFPPGYNQFQSDMAKKFPSAFLICFLSHELGADTLIIDRPWYENHHHRIAAFRELSQILYRDKDVVIIELSRTDINCGADAVRTESYKAHL